MSGSEADYGIQQIQPNLSSSKVSMKYLTLKLLHTVIRDVNDWFFVLIQISVCD